MEENIKYFICDGNKIPEPFSELDLNEYKEKSKGIVFHANEKNPIPNDSNIHVYFDQINLNTEQSLKLRVYKLANEELNFPKKLYVIENDDIKNLDDLAAILHENSYIDIDEEEVDIMKKETSNSFYLFTKEAKNLSLGSFEEYIKKLFDQIDCANAYLHVLKYMDIIYVSVTSSEIEKKDYCNYELLEAVGDYSMWRVMTEIFLRYMKKNKIEMKESVITSMHRSYASKEIQSKICEKLHLHKFARIKSEITMDVKEDIFEAFVGALYYINFLINSFLGIDFKLDSKFLEWCYEHVDFSDFEEKPEITKFHEYMKIMIGPSRFREIKTGRKCFMMFGEKKVSSDLFDVMSKITPKTDLSEFITTLLAKIKIPYGFNSQFYHKERREKFKNINDMIVDYFGEKTFIVLKNKKFISTWDEWEQEEFLSLMSKYIGKENILELFILDMRFYDHSKADYYWVVQKFSDGDKEEIFNTTMFSDPEKPETLISMIKSELELKNSSPKINQISNVKKVDYVDGDYFLENGIKYSLVGNKFEVEEFLRSNMGWKFPRNKYFIKLFEYPDTIGDKYSSENDVYMEYSPYHEISFSEHFDIDFVRTKIFHNLSMKIINKIFENKPAEEKRSKKNLPKIDFEFLKINMLIEIFERSLSIRFNKIAIKEDELLESIQKLKDDLEGKNIWSYFFDEYPRVIYRTIGDRMSYGQLALISMMKHEIHDEKNLNTMKNFYRSKNLKDEFTRMIGIHENNDQNSPLIGYDELLGMNYNISSMITQHFLTNLNFSKNIIIDPKKRLLSLNQKLSSDSQNKFSDKNGKIVLDGDMYKYTDSFKRTLSVKINGHFYSQVSYFFAKYLIEYEKKINPRWNTIQNSKYLNMPRYSEMDQILKHYNVLGWEMETVNKRKKYISISFEWNNDLYYYKGSEIETLIKQFPFNNQ